MPAASLTKRDAARHQVQLDQANRKAHHAYEALKEPTTDYLEAQYELVFPAHQVRDAGFTVTELHTPSFPFLFPLARVGRVRDGCGGP